MPGKGEAQFFETRILLGLKETCETWLGIFTLASFQLAARSRAVTHTAFFVRELGAQRGQTLHV